MSMKTAVAVLVMLVMASIPLVAAEPGTDVVGSLAWIDSTETTARTITANFNLTFPVSFLQIGPVLEYNYIRAAESEPAAVLPVTEEMVPVATASDPGGNSLSVWSFGGRGTAHFTKSHEGLYLGLEALMPQEDAEGVLGVLLGGYQKTIGDGNGKEGLLRVEYRRPYHYNEGELLDLGSQQVSVGFGARF